MGRRLSTPLVASAALAAALFASTQSTHAATPADYTLTRTFTLPTSVSPSGTVLIDALADGRLLAVNETQVLRETAVGSGTFASLGTLPNFAPTFGPSFLSVSPDGTRAAVGSNFGGSVTVFNTNAPATATNYTINDTDGIWVDNRRLAISNNNGVQVLNTTTGVVRTVIGNVGGASAGVALDAAGNLYTGNGFDTAGGGTGTGFIKAFTRTAWEAAAAGGTPLDFETGGRAIADLLSAASLGFDASGNLFVGGADFYDGRTDVGYAALVNATAVQAALASASATPPIDASSPAGVLRKFASPPDTVTAQQAPVWAYNDATGELYLRYFGQGAVGVYGVPEPTALCGLLLSGLIGLRRRRKQIVVVAGATSAQAYTFDPNDFATEVVASTNLPATSLYNDPAAVLGRPTLRFDSGNPAVPDLRRAKLIEGIFNTGSSGEKLITTFGVGQSLTVKMGRPITNDPAHPFGVDFNVFGNAFFSPGSIGPNTGDTTNLNTTTLGGVFAENVRVSVSPDNVRWYSYASGPTGDGLFPTTAYRWDCDTASWTNDELDPTKAVNPALRATLAGRTAADALDLYNGAAGGAGFDLAESPFASVRYVRFDGLSDYSGGEIDAVAAVVPEPTALGLAGLFAAVACRRRQS